MKYKYAGCSGLSSIIVESGNTVYDSRNNCNAIIKTETNELIEGFKNTIIPNSVTSIGNWAFSACSGLTSITIPSSLTNIEAGVFWGCTGLTEVRSMITEPFAINENCWNDVNKDIPLYVPKDTKEKYEATEGWNYFANIIEMEEGDVNGDDKVNVGDIMAVINVMAGVGGEAEKAAADINGDGAVNIGDIMAVINIMAGR